MALIVIITRNLAAAAAGITALDRLQGRSPECALATLWDQIGGLIFSDVRSCCRLPLGISVATPRGLPAGRFLKRDIGLTLCKPIVPPSFHHRTLLPIAGVGPT